MTAPAGDRTLEPYAQVGRRDTPSGAPARTRERTTAARIAPESAPDIQKWFREEYVQAKREVVAQATVSACVLVRGADGARTLRCGQRIAD